MKNYIRCAFKGCGKPCGHYYLGSDVADTNTKPILYSWCWLRGKSRPVDNGNEVDNTYYCCEAHYEGREKRQKVDNEGEEEI